jgi:superfamily II DNA/RNA helicase
MIIVRQPVGLEDLLFMKSALPSSPNETTPSSFDELGVPPTLIQNLRDHFNILTPTQIQVSISIVFEFEK